MHSSNIDQNKNVREHTQRQTPNMIMKRVSERANERKSRRVHVVMYIVQVVRAHAKWQQQARLCAWINGKGEYA